MPVCILSWMDRQVRRGFWFWFSLFLSFWNCTWNTPEHLTHDSSGVTHIKPSAGRRLYSWSQWLMLFSRLFVLICQTCSHLFIHVFMYLHIYWQPWPRFYPFHEHSRLGGWRPPYLPPVKRLRMCLWKIKSHQEWKERHSTHFKFQRRQAMSVPLSQSNAFFFFSSISSSSPSPWASKYKTSQRVSLLTCFTDTFISMLTS